MSATMHPLAAEYLERLRSAAAELPKDQRNELIADIEAHLGESIPPGASEAEVRTALDRLGDPDEIVAGYGVDERPLGAHAGGMLERVAQMLLLFGGFIGAFLGWAIGAVVDASQGGNTQVVATSIVVGALLGWGVGVVLLWISPVWMVGSKLLGTLLVPGGFVAAVFLPLVRVSRETCVPTVPGAPLCTGGIDPWVRVLFIAGWVGLVVLPILVAMHLGREAARRAINA